MAIAATPTAKAALRPMDLDTISDTWLKLITLNSPSPAAPADEGQAPAAGRAPARPAGDVIGNGLGGRRADADLFGRRPEQRQVSRHRRPHQQPQAGGGG